MGSWTVDDIPNQRGRTVLVTGANSGLGFRTSEALASKGARVLLACRSPERAAAALEHVKEVATDAAPETVALDLADLASVRACAERLNAELHALDVVVNNAGVMGIPPRKTADGFEMQFGTNHLGHFALTGLLLPVLRRAAAGDGGHAPRVVTVSSNVHRTGRVDFDDLMGERRYGKWKAYGQSKLANLLFAMELQRRSDRAGAGLLSLAAHPGYASTHLQAVGAEMLDSSLRRRVMDLSNRLLAQTDAEGALPQLYAATMPDVHGGEFFGPGGLAQLQGSPVVVKARRKVYDEALARRLWEESERLTGVTFDF